MIIIALARVPEIRSSTTYTKLSVLDVPASEGGVLRAHR